jgi:hypothetical protein
MLKSDAKLPDDEYLRRTLDLYPNFDLMTDAFKVVLEFDPDAPKQPIPDPVFRLRAR